MSDDASARGSQRGQALILAMLAMTVIFAIGAIVVDFGFWLSERRGAQTDADFVALAGAWELLDPNGDPITAATDSWDANNEQGYPELPKLTVDDSCVAADVSHSSVSIFSGIFGALAPEIGAHAKACAGATNAPPGIVPFDIDTEMDCFVAGTPKFNDLCALDFDPDRSPRGILDLDAPGDHCSDEGGGGNLERFIETGVDSTCLIYETGNCRPGSNDPWYDCVAVDDADRAQVMSAVEGRIVRQGDCDSDRNGNETFPNPNEVVDVIFAGSASTTMYQAKDCNSPRLVNVIVRDPDPAPGSTGHPIDAFAGFYIAGCGSELSADPIIDPDCRGGGHTVVYGRFVNLIVANSETGPQGPSTTLFSIALEE